ncbi:unnamed protein product [Boreogadus saida]
MDIGHIKLGSSHVLMEWRHIGPVYVVSKHSPKPFLLLIELNVPVTPPSPPISLLSPGFALSHLACRSHRNALAGTMCVCVYVCESVCMCVSVWVFRFVCVSVFACMCVCVYVSVCGLLCVCLSVCV